MALVSSIICKNFNKKYTFQIIIRAQMLLDTMRYTHNFSNNNQGSVAIFFAVMLIPVIGFLGAAVDYAIALRSRGIQQNISDEAALLIANAETSAAAIAGLKFAHDEISKRFAKTSNQEDTSIVEYGLMAQDIK